MNLLQYQQISAGRGTPSYPWPPPPRAPLPPFPDQPLPYTTSLWWEPPQKIDIDYWRGNAWCVTVPGLPPVPGGCEAHPDRLLTYLFDRYSRDWQVRCLEEYQRRGYTHFTLSWPDSHFGSGQSLSDFLDMAALVKRYVPFVHVFLTSKVYDPAEMLLPDYQARVGEPLAAMLSSGVVDILSPGWEWNLWQLPGRPCHEIFGWVGDKAAEFGKPNYCHFSTHYTSWQANDESQDRWGFWRDHNPNLKPTYGPMRGLLYQGGAAYSDPEWYWHHYQGRIGDTTNRPETIPTGWGSAFNFVAWEVLASEQFNTSTEHPNETDGDQAGYILQCTPGVVPVMGYGNGGRRRNGAVL